jgi:hypothetical protein
MGGRESVHLDALGLDHLGPLVDFFSDVFCEAHADAPSEL